MNPSMLPRDFSNLNKKKKNGEQIHLEKSKNSKVKTFREYLPQKPTCKVLREGRKMERKLEMQSTLWREINGTFDQKLTEVEPKSGHF